MLPAITVLKETARWLVIEKPAGMVVHPPAASPTFPVSSSQSRTPDVTNWLLTHYPTMNDLPWPEPGRPGIVHRLDTDTSGVLLLAKNPDDLIALQAQFKDRTTRKLYRALVLGAAPKERVLIGIIQRKEGRTEQTVKRLHFSWDKAPQKQAETVLRTIAQYTHGESLRQHSKGDRENLTQLTLVELQPKTGRTHQLRVQLLDAGLPIIGDRQYCTKVSRSISNALGLHRQFLHAVSLSFTDPKTGERITVSSPLPRDLQTVLDQVR
ncbi:RluA family pseudouridine synthase [Candidatus Berkelbacteria bacterium]|nr:RluA family pseudouridine synthase [Candidatus Berkelbacteria bacterium]